MCSAGSATDRSEWPHRARRRSRANSRSCSRIRCHSFRSRRCPAQRSAAPPRAGRSRRRRRPAAPRDRPRPCRAGCRCAGAPPRSCAGPPAAARPRRMRAAPVRRNRAAPRQASSRDRRRRRCRCSCRRRRSARTGARRRRPATPGPDRIFPRPGSADTSGWSAISHDRSRSRRNRAAWRRRRCFSGAVSSGNRACRLQMSSSFCAIKVPFGDW